jgi:hypothetical protein
MTTLEKEPWFTCVKVGYTAGMYGCSGEYFLLITSAGNSISFSGMYGVEDRVASVLKDRGYKEIYTPSDFGRMTLKDVRKRFKSEYEAVEIVKTLS